MARIAIAGIQHESNTFVPAKTRLADFMERSEIGKVLRGSELAELEGLNWGVSGFSAAARASGHELVPLLFAIAEPGGIVERHCFERLSSDLVDGLKAAGTIDGLYLELHGAMVVEGDLDGDELLLERARACVGPDVRIVASFDLHANVSPQKLQCADAAIAYRTYPHVDIAETGRRAAQLLDELFLDRRPLHSAHRYLPFIIPVNKQATLGPPGSRMYEELAAIEAAAPAVATMSLCMGFQLADIEEPLPSIFAFSFDQSACERAVDELEAWLASREDQFTHAFVTVEQATQVARDYTGSLPLILADAQDNPGGGGSSDTMFLIRGMLAAGIEGVAAAMIFDPTAAAAAHKAGVGAELNLDLGGRTVAGDAPLSGTFTVISLAEGAPPLTGPMANGAKIDLGKAALLRIGQVEIVVASKRTQCLDQGYFRHLGIEPASRHVLIVKSAVHFRAHFDPICGRRLDVIAPGFEAMDFREVSYTRLRADIRYDGQPIVKNPLQGRALPGNAKDDDGARY